MSDSLRVMLRVAASTVLALALCLGLVLGVTGCGDDEDDAGVTTTTSADAGDGTSATDSSGVDSQTGAALIGEWYCEELDETLEFTADGEMIWTRDGEEPSTVISYAIENGEIAVSIEATEGAGYLPYSIEGGVLTIEDPELGPITYTREQ